MEVPDNAQTSRVGHCLTRHCALRLATQAFESKRLLTGTQLDPTVLEIALDMSRAVRNAFALLGLSPDEAVGMASETWIVGMRRSPRP